MHYIIAPMATPEDMAGKGYVHYQAWNEAYTGLVDQDYLDRRSAEKCIEMARRWPQNTLVAKVDDKVIGFACYHPCRDEDMPEAGEIQAIYILQEYYGQKIGYALMNAALAQLCGHSQIVVWVLKGNERAIRFYERYGFRFDGTEKELMMGSARTVLRMVYTRTD